MSRRKWNYETITQVVNGENPFLQVGYTPKSVKRKLGEIWTDTKGITWEQRSGYKVRVNKQADTIREFSKQICKSCDKDIKWGNKYDDIMFSKTGKCYDCVIQEETEMRLNGTYTKYEQTKVLKNKLTVAKDYKQKIIESISFLENYDGKLKFNFEETNTEETWSDNQKDILLSEAKNDLIEINKIIDELSTGINQLENS